MKKKIFISGASKGIGFAIADAFYQKDFDVIICARNSKGLAAAKEKLPNLHLFQCDISDKSAVKTLADTLNEQFGAMDVLVNNGGVFQPGQLFSEDDSVFETMMSTNVASAYYLTKGVLPLMMEKKSGTIVNIASIASINAYANGGSYSISKYAMLGFSKNLREEMKEFNIRVVSIMPGAVFTASWEGADVPEERLMPSEDIASLVWNAYSLSPRTVVEDIVVRPFLGDL